MLRHVSQDLHEEPNRSGREAESGLIDDSMKLHGTKPRETTTSKVPSSFLDDDTQERVEKASEKTVEHSDPYEDKLEPIAIVGIAFRGPQDAISPSALWNLLEQRRSAMTTIPGTRFNVETFSSIDDGRAGLNSVSGGHFLREDLAGFDAPFFAMSATEANGMDPQQRWLLETTYEALENAGIPLQKTAGTKTSVHIGNFTQEYTVLLNRDLQMKTPYKATGTGPTMLANRLSWYYDWTGPSVAIDTACSSSLTAVHLACQALRTGDSDMAVAGGCNVIINPDFMFALTDMGFLSPDNVCKSFDTDANGYSRGEGFGLVILKRLRDAIRDDDVIRAVVRATGVNQDAKTPSLTQPSSESQEALIRDTYEAGGLSMEPTRFFEAHGTGTAVGDPIEATAIRDAFREQLTGHPLYIGAVKSNLGHLEGASGVAGLIKAVLALEKGVIPPNLWPNTLNPKISKDWNLQFPRDRLEWPCPGLRRASVNSFGYGGSNAHCVLNDAYHYLESRGLHGNHNTQLSRPTSGNNLYDNKQGGEQRNTGTALLVWSAPDEKATKRLTTAYTEYLADMTQSTSIDHHRLAYTLSERRTKFSWRSFSVCSRKEEVDELAVDKASSAHRSIKNPDICFVFSGQGAQSARMGLELRSYPVFARALDYADRFYRSLGACWSLNDELEKRTEKSTIDQPDLSQPLCTALQLALVDLLESWNVHPHVVVGHSSGEIAAAFSLGAISRDAALKIAYFRGIVATSVQQTSRCPQGMMSANISKEAAEDRIKRICASGPYLTVACSNSPNNVTISGDVSGLDHLQTNLDQEGIFCRRLKVNVAYHSEHMNGVANLYALLMGHIDVGSSKSGTVAMISTVTGMRVDESELRQSSYWVQNLIAMVNFSDAIGTIAANQSQTSRKRLNQKSDLQVDHFLEIGPHPVLKAAIQKSYSRSSKMIASCSTMLDRRLSATTCALQAAGELYCMGVPVSILEVNNLGQAKHINFLVDLPSYPFDHSRSYWQESRLSHEFRFRKHGHHELLGNPVMEWNSLEPSWRNIFHVSDSPWVAEHKIQDSTILPATCMITLIMEAARQIFTSEKAVTGYRIKNMVISKAIVIPADSGNIEWQTHLRPCPSSSNEVESWADFHLYIYEDTHWVQVCTGMVGIHFSEAFDKDMEGQSKSPPEHTDTLSRTSLRKFSSQQFYDSVRPLGYDYGSSFRGIKDLTVNTTTHEAYGVVDLNHWKLGSTRNVNSPYVVHPAAFDAMLQFALAASLLSQQDSTSQILPSQFDEIWISDAINNHTALEDAYVHASLDSQGFRAAQFSLDVLDPTNDRPLIRTSFQATFTQARQVNDDNSLVAHDTKMCYNVGWKPDIDFLDEKNFGKIFEMKEADPDSVAKDVDNECLVSLMCDMLKDRSLSPKVLSAQPHFEMYQNWMKSASERHKRTSIRHVCHEHIGSILERVQSAGIVGQLTAKVAMALPQVLDGDLDPLELLFGDGLLDAYYADAHGSADVFSNIARYVDLLAHKNPSLRVLEIGAGTGGCTTSVIGALSENEAAGQYVARFSEYTFTDISSSFFERAREKFSNNAERMEFKTLNIEKDLESQGIQPYSYDLVVASNVIHATACIHNTLKNTRKLLKPGGSFILYEGIQPEALTPGLTFGLLSGWWLSTEAYRQYGPLTTEEKWSEELQAAGFASPHIKLRDDEDPQVHAFTAMISRAVSDKNDHIHPRARIMIVIQDTTLQRTCSQQICSRLHSTLGVECQTRVLADVNGIDDSTLKVSHLIFLPDLTDTFLLNMTEAEFSMLKRLLIQSTVVIWPTLQGSLHDETPASSMVVGFLRSVRMENERLKAVTIALESDSTMEAKSDIITQCYQQAILSPDKDVEYEYDERSGLVGTVRLREALPLNKLLSRKMLPQEPQPTALGDGSRPMKLTVGNPGLLNTLQWIDDPDAERPVSSDELKIKVECAGLNFLDLLTALGQINKDFLGGEAAGTVVQSGDHNRFKPGERVVCVAFGAFKSFVRCDMLHAVKIPDSVNFRSAAALPIIYCTAYYSLMHKAHLRRVETVLVHSGAGGFGQATIQLAQLEGAEIYTTVSNDSKRDFLVSKYGIPPDHIFSSRSCAFANQIRVATKGKGVDVVVNSLSGEKLRASWECVAPFGRFIEVGKKDIETFQDLPMKRFSGNVSFSGVDLVHLAAGDPKLTNEILQTVIDLLVAGKISVPDDFRVYDASRMEEAFRFMQSGKAIGKAVFEFRSEDIVQAIPDSNTSSYSFDPDATYVISGGLGGLGRSAARWMSGRGARHLILLSRREPSSYTSEITSFLEDLEEMGVIVARPVCDVSDYDRLKEVLSVCTDTMPPIKGCLQGSMVLRDSSFNTMSLSEFQTAVRPKVQGSWNLHKLLPKDLDFFILLSSAAGIIGNHGQCNYNAGNTFQDSLARHRIRGGQKAVSFDLGLMQSIGYVATQLGPNYTNNLLSSNEGMTEAEFLAMLEVYCNPHLPIADEDSTAQVVSGISTAAMCRARGIEDVYWLEKPIFRYLHQIDSSREKSSASTTQKVDYSTMLKQTSSLADASDVICEAVVQKLSRAIAVDVQDVDVSKPLHVYGIDSLSAVELRNWFAREIHADVAVLDILGNNTIANLSKVAAELSRLVSSQAKKAAGVID